MGSDIDPDVAVSKLAAAERSLVAIGRALAVKSDILVLDEPTAALPEADVSRLLDALRRLRVERHRHHLCHASARRGVPHRRPGDGAARRAARRDSMPVARNLAGGSRREDRRPLDERRVRQAGARRPSAIVLEVDGVVAENVGPVSFTVAAGETLGLVGLRGAGHHTIGRAIFGQIPLSTGHVSSRRRARSIPPDPADAMRKQIGFVSSRRAEESIAANMSVRENIYINPAATGRRVLQPVWRARRARRDPRGSRALFGQAARPRARDRDAERRQPAEGGARALDGGEGALAGSRGADDRRRRRLQGGDLSPSSAIAESRASRCFCSRPISRKWSASAIARWCSAAARSCPKFQRGELDVARLTADASGGAQSAATGARA